MIKKSLRPIQIQLAGTSLLRRRLVASHKLEATLRAQTEPRSAVIREAVVNEIRLMEEELRRRVHVPVARAAG